MLLVLNSIRIKEKKKRKRDIRKLMMNG